MMPSVPKERLAEGGWTLVEETSETRFEMPTMRVIGHTRLYEDVELRETIDERTGIDRPWRFFFATRLEFEPPLAPGIGPAMLYGSVSTEAKREFATDLESRGFGDVSRGRDQRMRTETRDRASLTKYSANYRLDPVKGASTGEAGRRERGSLPVTGWLAIWTYENAFRLAGGAYPDRSPADVLDIGAEPLETGASSYREELLDLMRAVR